MNIVFIIIILVIAFWIINDLLKLFEHAYLGPCYLSDGTYGTLDNDKCIPLVASDPVSGEGGDSIDGEGGDSTYDEGADSGGDGSDLGSGTDTDPDTDYSNASVCFPDNSDFGEICNLRHNSSDYGIKSFDTTDCESGKKKVECGKFFYNEIDYNENNISSTPCLEKSIDFDEACRYYQPSRPTLKNQGYNVNSVGVKQKLFAQDGDCYHSDGSSNLTKARGLCNLDYLERVTKLDNFPNNYDYNVFTECNKIDSNFKSECATKLDINNSNAYAYVGGYDCNPGYARAKCIDISKGISIPENEKKFLIDAKSDYLGFQSDSDNS